MIHVSSIMDEALLQRMIDEKFITKRPNPWIDGMHIYSYADKAMFSKEWNDATMNCRGLILDKDGYVAARPWKKFHNYSEVPDLISPDTLVEVTDKADGSLGLVSLYKGQILFSTRGSFESEQADHMRQVWLNKYSAVILPEQYTFLFEIIFKSNRIVLDYGDMDDLVLLGAVSNLYGWVQGPNEAAGLLGWRGPVTEVLHSSIPFGEVLTLDRGPGYEGVVCRSGNSLVKIKQISYVELHKIISNLSPKSVWQALKDGGSPRSICEDLPDEFHAWVIDTSREFMVEFLSVQGQVWDEFNRLRPLASQGGRKLFALEAIKSPFKGMLFAMLDGKDESEMIYDWVWDAYRSKQDKEKEES